MSGLDSKLIAQLKATSEFLRVPIFVLDTDKDEVIFNSNNTIYPSNLCNQVYSSYKKLENKPLFFVKRETTEEIYSIISFKKHQSSFCLIGGPFLEYLPKDLDAYKNFAFSKDISFEHYLSFRKYLTEYEIGHAIRALELIYALVEGKQINKDVILNNSSQFLLDEKSIEDESKTLIDKHNIDEREKYSYNDELSILNMITNGDIETLSRKPQFLFSKVDRIVEKDKDNFLYLSIAIVTLASRAAINGGVDIYYALSKSDHYIRRLDKATNGNEIGVLIKQMVYDYAYEVYRLKNKKKYSTSINKAINYINLNIHTHISLEDIAKYVGLNPKYLSRHFIDEVGIKISTYIRNQRLQEATSLLKYTNEDYSSIAYKLCFPSQSYFVEVFKKEYGVTPKVYREKNSKML